MSITSSIIDYATANLSTTWKNDKSAPNPINFQDGSMVQSILLINSIGRLNGPPVFSCGFICYGTCMSYHFGIFIVRISGDVPPQVVWLANRDRPVGLGATLNLSPAGELILQDSDGSTVWTTNTTGKSVSGMNLTNTGNLVLFDVYGLVVWQSFDHPTDCLLPGQTLLQGQKLIASVSSTNWTTRKSLYSLEAKHDGLYAYFTVNPHPYIYYKSAATHSFDFQNDTQKSNVTYGNGGVTSTYSLVSGYNKQTNIVTFANGSLSFSYLGQQTYMKLMSDGHLRVFEWQQGWTGVADLLSNSSGGCDTYPMACGKNTICSNVQLCSCLVKDHFRAVPLFKSESGSSERNCYLPSEIYTLTKITDVGFDSDRSYVAFIKIQKVRPSFALVPTSQSAFSPTYLNFAPSPKKRSELVKLISLTTGSFIVMVVVAAGFIIFIIRKRKLKVEMEEDYLDQVPGMPTRFCYEELQTATENFSKKLGEGGFGSVFKGILQEDNSKIAVKCLDGLGQVKNSFLAEVESIGSVHHVNLVRLRGFCAWKSQRLLVYEFMSNGSLDQWIYHGDREHILGWVCRKKIILDIAKGLTYLHEDCRQKIIHLDIKPQNILLDDDFNAKVSDFGLSKLIDRNQTQVLTTRVKGTPGYIAPEWWSSIITEKVDVFSFGVVLLEILCGRKIFDRSLPEESWHLLAVFQRSWEQGVLLDMVDVGSSDMVDRYSEDMQAHGTEVVEMMKVASWCLQTNFARRPSMSSVVKVLEGVKSVESNLDYNFTDPRMQTASVKHEDDWTQLSPSHLSGPR
uniref:Receptor-like serine/threonine-protein kinase n=1 Tax=Tanacetum cinerariifolium TaxID=118510 RepID=A0A699HUG4_TANCI|nr:G-type lectin S-receptor-like serine/threonine-protein kinase SD2-5 [Tanacetum cinerariifolium]